jgi:hypothetical protein
MVALDRMFVPSFPTRRLYGLDAWRALLLSLGPVFHAALIGGEVHADADWLSLLATVLHSFRMEAFFAVSGFLMAYRGNVATTAWLRLRLRQLGLPLLVCWVTALPVSRLFAGWRGGPGSGWSPLDPKFLWFLLTLIAITPVLWGAAPSDRTARLVRALDRRPALWAGAVVAAILAVLVGKTALHLLQHRWPDLAGPGFTVPRTLAAAPYYGLFAMAGLLAARSRGAMAHLSHGRWWLLGPAALLAYAAAVWGLDAAPDAWADAGSSATGTAAFLARLLLPVVVAAAMTHCVLALGVRPRRASRPISVMTDAAFTVYLFHLVPLEALAWLLGSHLSPAGFFVVAATGSLLASLAFHLLLIRPFPLAAALFNGRLRARPAPAAAGRCRPGSPAGMDDAVKTT